MSYLFYGGIFLSPTEVETVRAAAYKYYHLDPVYREGKLPRVMLMTRAKVAGNLPGRKIANQNELSLFLRQSKQWLYSEGAMELLTPEEQAATMLNTDVLIGVLGSGFANVIYMLPGSVAISFSPPFVGGFFFSTMAEYCQIRYLPVYNYSIVPPNECTGLLGTYGEMKGDSEYCLSTLYTADIYFNIGTMSSLMHQSLTHLRIHKYHTQWSVCNKPAMILKLELTVHLKKTPLRSRAS